MEESIDVVEAQLAAQKEEGVEEKSLNEQLSSMHLSVKPASSVASSEDRLEVDTTPKQTSPALKTSSLPPTSDLTPTNSDPTAQRGITPQGDTDVPFDATQPSPSISAVPSQSLSASTSTAPPLSQRSRSSSQLRSSRPAPSPTPSRRTSQVISTGHSPDPSSRRTSQTQIPYPPSPTLSRDRASSTSSSLAASNSGHNTTLGPGTSGSSTPSGTSGISGMNNQGRKLSHSRSSQSNPRPRSSLGTAMYTGNENEAFKLDSSLNSTSIEEVKSSQNTPSKPAAPLPDSTTPTLSTSTPAQSTEPSRSPSQSHASRPSGSSSVSGGPSKPLSPAPSSSTPQSPRKQSNVHAVIIRDYAFPPTDDRFHGQSIEIGDRSQSASSSRLSQFLRTAGGDRRESDQSNGSTGSSGSNSRKNGNGQGGWSGFSLLGWRGFMSSSSSKTKKSSSSTNLQSPEIDPSSTSSAREGDMDLSNGGLVENGGFLDGDDSELDLGVQAGGDDYAFESSSDDDNDGTYMNGEETEEEPSGLYRAAYEFIAEGEHEIGLEEGEVIQVKGRGGGVGWVIAIKLNKKFEETGNETEKAREKEISLDGDGMTDGVNSNVLSMSENKKEGKEGEGKAGKSKFIEGLVPESYLEKVDDEEVRIGMISAGWRFGQSRTVAPDGISEEPEEESDLESGNER